ncbi:MAG: nucleotidyl transferase [Microgenomates group bacterium Gr01-1014_7]|nr:MAG: nucleotidyl transferase [Microgenomates group bacterium Gr01-1014_7]
MSNPSEICVAILAGGFGTRLQSTVKGNPKALAEVRKHPFLEYLLHQLDQANFKKIVLCTGYLSDQIEKTFGERYKNLRLYYSPEQLPLGTAGGLRKALPLLNSESILVMNGDSFCEVDFKKIWQFHLNKKSKASLVLSSVSDTSRFGTVKLGKNDNIIGFQEKKGGSEAGLINAGIYLINKTFIAEIPKDKEMSLEKNVFPNWIGKGFYGYKSNNNFIDIGIPENYAQAEQFFAKYQL